MDTVPRNCTQIPDIFPCTWAHVTITSSNQRHSNYRHSLDAVSVCLVHNNPTPEYCDGMPKNCPDISRVVFPSVPAVCVPSCDRLSPCSAEVVTPRQSADPEESPCPCATSISFTPANPAEGCGGALTATAAAEEDAATLQPSQRNCLQLAEPAAARVRSRSFGSGLCLRDYSGLMNLPSRRSPSPKPGLQGPLRARYYWALVRQYIYCSFAIQGDKRKPWVQLAGHKDSFQTGKEVGTVLKKMCPEELHCLTELMNDSLKSFVPLYLGMVTDVTSRQDYMIMRDLLIGFDPAVSVMDCKIGIRTYLEDELTKARKKPELRPDMYQKMIELDRNAPTAEEHAQKAVTKPRYMQWRETLSSSASLGFRVEGIKKLDGFSSKDFKFTKSRQDVITTLKMFTDCNKDVIQMYILRLRVLKKALLESRFFAAHEVIGTSLLFIHDKDNLAGIWMIDFAKTVPLPADVHVDHVRPWEEGNHEDGYLFGLNNLIDCFEELQRQLELTKSV
ncbi:inositol-trisphosphate 3-kinase A-like [Paramacrobiotus metropolitanus]|uniref:inositol-trisphosphate 3-kinase A-like n=1 Tax=Paramacrobiotus metropolitanus TaxID=2943436 RepID=UPI002445DD16|nr:inositol-trisphosphate 3-kinase A-like [Paramacrobiotus metropolitanus]XP_055340079.1 inositol-trisphosphate 3-kinase A-like [Paramacrobiotus metropolitanus]